MLASDVGPEDDASHPRRLRESLGKNELGDADAVWAALRAEATRILTLAAGPSASSAKPTVVLMVGVNGVGKTTTIGKLATRYSGAGKKVLLAAGDTFRAAAVQQLEVWGKRVGAEVVRGKEGADPGAVAFDATTRAREAAEPTCSSSTPRAACTPRCRSWTKSRRSARRSPRRWTALRTRRCWCSTPRRDKMRCKQAAMFKEAARSHRDRRDQARWHRQGWHRARDLRRASLPVRYVGLGERAEDFASSTPTISSKPCSGAARRGSRRSLSSTGFRAPAIGIDSSENTRCSPEIALI